MSFGVLINIKFYKNVTNNDTTNPFQLYKVLILILLKSKMIYMYLLSYDQIPFFKVALHIDINFKMKVRHAKDKNRNWKTTVSAIKYVQNLTNNKRLPKLPLSP